MVKFENKSQDVNFDHLAKRFSRNVYGGLKGAIRLAVLKRDFDQWIPGIHSKDSLSILDAGAGQGHFSINLANLGHQLTLTDISEQMLNLARQRIQRDKLTDRVTLVAQPLQNLRRYFSEGGSEGRGQFDIVICHAVMEWLAEPNSVFDALLPLVKPQGFFSLLYYNYHGLQFKNLLRTNFNLVDAASFQAYKGSLTPINPLEPNTVMNWLRQQPLTLICNTGVRVFHDYIFDRQIRENAANAIVEKELEYSTRDPFWRMARYIHLLCKKNG